MKILRVRLHGFGAFNHGLDVSLAPDRLNLVVGRNEAGKSTLMNSVFGVLFGFRDLNMVRKYEPWDDHDTYSGELEIETEEGRRLRIWRDFNTSDAQIEMLNPEPNENPMLFDGRADPRSNRDEDLRYYEEIGRILGFKDEGVFRNTVFFGQQSLTTAVSDQIRRLISGSTSIDYKGALHELHSRFAELTTENPWRTKNNGRRRLIEETRDELAQDRERLVQGHETLSRSLELETEVADLEIRVARADDEELEERTALEAHERLHVLLQRQADARRRYDDALARRDTFLRYSSRDRELEDEIDRKFSHFRQSPEDFPEKLRQYASEQTAMQREIDALAKERKDLDQLRPRPNTKNGVTVGGLLGGSALVAGLLSPIGPAVGAVAGAAGGLLGFNIGRNVGTGFREEKGRLQERLQQLQNSVKSRRKICEDLLPQLGSAVLGREPEEVIAEFRGFRELREERKRLVAAMKALGDEASVSKAFDEATRERGTVGAALETLCHSHPSLAGLEDRSLVGQKIERLRSRCKGAKDELARNRTRLEEARVDLARIGTRFDTNLAGLADDVRDKEKRLASYDLEKDAMKLAIDTLDTCVKDFQESDVFRLSEEMSTIFAQITDKKYDRVHLGAGMEPVISRGDQVAINPESLSQGAQDQLYFAMRIAMARHLSRNVKLPLLLDDPFVNFDADRLRVTKDVLDHLTDHQVIMVTCNRDYEPWTDAILDLDAARAAQS